MNLIVEDAGNLIPICILVGPNQGESQADFLERIARRYYPNSTVIGLCDEVPFLDDKDHDTSITDRVAFKVNADKQQAIIDKQIEASKSFTRKDVKTVLLEFIKVIGIDANDPKLLKLKEIVNK